MFRLFQSLGGLRRRLYESDASRRLIENAAWLVADKLGRLGVGMVVLVWTARYLGPESFGLFNYGQALVVIFTAFATMGMSDIAVRDIVRTPEREQEIMASALLLRLAGGVLAMAMAMAMVAVVRPGDLRALLIVAILASALVPQAFDVIDYRFQAHMMVRPVVILRNATFLLFAALKCLAIVLQATLPVFAVLTAGELAMVAVLLTLYARRHGLSVHPRCASSAEAQRLWGECWALLIRTFAIAAYMRTDQVMLAYFRGDAQVGLYAAAIRLPELWYFLPTAVMTAAIPVLARSYTRSQTDYERNILQIMRPLVWLSAVVAATLSLFAEPIIMLLYGPAYAGAGDVLAIYSWAGVFGTLGLTTNSWLINAGLMRYGLYQALAGLAVSIALNAMLIPTLGIVGAAWSYLGAQCISTFAINLAFRPTRAIFRGQLRTFGFPV